VFTRITDHFFGGFSSVFGALSFVPIHLGALSIFGLGSGGIGLGGVTGLAFGAAVGMIRKKDLRCAILKLSHWAPVKAYSFKG